MYGSTRRIIAVALASATLVASCGSNGHGNGQGNGQGDEGVTHVGGSLLDSQLATIGTSVLTAADRTNLAYMREEERLAHDVYVALGERWGLRTFENIARAEATHTTAVKTLLDRYGITDPVGTNAPGVFTDQELQALYTSLTAQGSASLTEALRVGALIEELDIADLQARRSAAADVQLVFDNLERGSRNHLRAFNRQLTNNGVTYQPTHISQADFDSIVNSPTERGGSAA